MPKSRLADYSLPRQRQGVVGRLVQKRRQRLAQKRADRAARIAAAVKRNQIQAVPLLLNGSALTTGVAAAIDPVTGAAAGAVTTAVALAGAGFQLESKREIGLVAGQTSAGLIWSSISWFTGLGNPYLIAGGLVVAGIFQLSWIDQRRIRTTTVAANKSVDELWNTEEIGILAQIGAQGARMYRHSVVRNRDGMLGLDAGDRPPDLVGQLLQLVLARRVALQEALGEPDRAHLRRGVEARLLARADVPNDHLADRHTVGALRCTIGSHRDARELRRSGRLS